MNFPITPWIDNYISLLTQSGVVLSPKIEAAFRKVARHRLIERYFLYGESGWVERVNDPENLRPEHLDFIYANNPIVTLVAGNRAHSSSSQPSLVAGMLAWLEVEPGLKILEIGAGTGYNAALLAELVGDQNLVFTVDIDPDIISKTKRLLANAGYPDIHLLARDGFLGVEEVAPFDRIVATVGCPDLSPHWVEQLAPRGIMLIPLSHGGWHPLLKVSLQQGKIVGNYVSQSGFMPILGSLEMNGPWQFTHNAELSLETSEEEALLDRFNLEKQHGDFYFFLALRDSRTVWTGQPYTYGLYESTLGHALINPASQTLFVAAGHKLVNDLQRLYHEWNEAGRPTRQDYHIEFRPVSEEFGEFPPQHWALRRKFYWQIFSV